MWITDCIILGSMTVYFGANILNFFTIHLDNRRGMSDPSADNIRYSMIRVKAISTVLTLNYIFYAIIKSVYCIGRDKMMVDKTFNIAVCTAWNLLGTISVTLVLAALIFNPKLLNPFSFSSKSFNTEATCISTDKAENYLKPEDMSTIHCKSIEIVCPKQDDEEQNNFYNMVMENSKAKKDDVRYLKRESVPPI
ncbi:unnamed protein product [Rhizopus stolonifer]